MSRRTKTIIADDGDTKITVWVEAISNGLTRHETKEQIEAVASNIMTGLVGVVPYFGVRLSQIKVRT